MPWSYEPPNELLLFVAMLFGATALIIYIYGPVCCCVLIMHIRKSICCLVISDHTCRYTYQGVHGYVFFLFYLYIYICSLPFWSHIYLCVFPAHSYAILDPSSSLPCVYLHMLTALWASVYPYVYIWLLPCYFWSYVCLYMSRSHYNKKGLQWRS